MERYITHATFFEGKVHRFLVDTETGEILDEEVIDLQHKTKLKDYDRKLHRSPCMGARID